MTRVTLPLAVDPGSGLDLCSSSGSEVHDLDWRKESVWEKPGVISLEIFFLRLAVSWLLGLKCCPDCLPSVFLTSERLKTFLFLFIKCFFPPNGIKSNL